MLTMLLKLSGFDANGSLLIIRGGVLAAHRERRQSRLQRRDLVGISRDQRGEKWGTCKGKGKWQQKRKKAKESVRESNRIYLSRIGVPSLIVELRDGMRSMRGGQHQC